MTSVRCALAFACIALACAVQPAGAADAPWGKTLVASYTLPRDALDRFNTLKPYENNPKLSTLENMISRDSQGWQAASALQVSSKANPYRIVIRYEGEVLGDKGAITLWNAGWFREGTAQTSDGVVATPLAGLNVSAADGKQGARVTRVGAAGPLSFRYDGDAYPAIEVTRLDGLRLDRVEVEVWSGLPNASWTEMVFGWQSALVGLVMLAVWFMFFRRRRD